MRCVRPFIRADGAFGCGQCMPCRFVRQRVWLHRILLESYLHATSAFVTLTYRPECDPGSLRPVDVQLWLKRLRRRFSPAKLRFFLVGEYGDRFGRPHYHAALFGYPTCVGGPVCDGECRCRACLDVRESWGFGHVHVGRLEEKSARYIARYTLKKMTSATDSRLHGRFPEFSRQSRRPGIGVDAMWDVASVLLRYPSKRQPLWLDHGRKPLPLGRLLREKVRLWSDSYPQEFTDEVLPLVRAFAAQEQRSVQSVYQEVNGPFERRLEGQLSPQSPLSTLQQQKKIGYRL